MAQLLQFSGGLQDTTSQFIQKDDQLSLSINVNGDNIGVLEKRHGYSQLGNDISAGSPVNGLKMYADIGGGTTRLFGASNGNIKYSNGAAWTSVTTYTVSTAKIDMTVFLDQLFVVGSDGSSFITPINIDGVTASNTNLTNAPQAKYCAVFNDQLYFANCKIAGDRFPSRLYRSSLPDVAATAITWPSTNFDNILTNNGEEINAIHTNKTLGQLLIFKSNSMHAWDGYRIKDLGNIGTDNGRSVVTINSTTYYFSLGKGIYAYGGTIPILISRAVDKWVQGIQDPTKIHAISEDERFYKLYVGDILRDGKTYTNCEIRYSTLDNTFTIYSYAEDFTVYAEHKISNIVRVYAGTTLGKVHQMALKTDAVYSDNGTEISAEFMTKPLDMNMPEKKVFFDMAVIYTLKTQNLQGRIRSRAGDWTTYFTVNKSEEPRNLNPADGRFLQFHFSETSTNTPFQFEGLSFSGGKTTNYA